MGLDVGDATLVEQFVKPHGDVVSEGCGLKSRAAA